MPAFAAFFLAPRSRADEIMGQIRHRLCPTPEMGTVRGHVVMPAADVAGFIVELRNAVRDVDVDEDEVARHLLEEQRQAERSAWRWYSGIEANGQHRMTREEAMGVVCAVVESARVVVAALSAAFTVEAENLDGACREVVKVVRARRVALGIRGVPLGTQGAR